MTVTANIKFKVQGVGIDTSTIITKPWEESRGEIYDYIHTSISGNNDFLISDYVKSQPGAALITTIDFIDNPELVLLGHLMVLERDKIDLLLVNGNALERRIDNIKDIIIGLKNSKLIEEFGISEPSSIEQIKKVEDAIGKKIKFISLDICPLHFNYDVINYAKENSIDILGFNPFGGHLSSGGVIESFTIPYLLAFSSTYSSIIFLSGRNLLGSIECRDYIRANIIGSESASKYILKKNVSRLYKPIKKVVDTSIILREDLVLSYNLPEVMYPLGELYITLGKSYNLFPKGEEERSDLEKEVFGLLEITSFPQDATLDDIYAICRHQVIGTLKINFPEEDGWKINLINVGDRILGIGVTRKIKNKKFWKKSGKQESSYFLLAVPDRDNIVFLEENSDNKNTSQEE